MSPRLDRQKTLIGGLVILVLLALVVSMAMTRMIAKTPKGVYEVVALFNQADGIGLRSQVRLSGIPVGQVVGYQLDPQFRAVVTLRLDLTTELPDDTSASIQTEGLFGAKYIELTTGGGGFGPIPSGERLDYTQDSVILESLLEKIVALAKIRRGLDPNLPAAGQKQKSSPPVSPPAAQ